MEPYLLWLIIGFALVIAELTTGTFYLLVLGAAAFAGGLAAFLGFAFWVQAVTATLLAGAGVWLVYTLRAKPGARSANAIDVGQMVTIESWVSEADGIARVRYRGALWDAQVVGERGAGAVYYIRGAQGSTLQIAAARE